MAVAVLDFWVERDGTAQVDFRFLKASQLIERHAEIGMYLIVVWALFGSNAVRVEGFFVAFLLV